MLIVLILWIFEVNRVIRKDPKDPQYRKTISINRSLFDQALG